MLALPAQAQRGGGHGGFSRGSGGGKGRSMPAPPAGAHLRGTGTPARMRGRVSSPSVVVLRGNFVQSPTHHVVLRHPIGFLRPVPVHPVFVQRPFVFFRFHHFHHRVGFPFCSPVSGVGFATRHFGFFHRELVCFPHPFFSPFFFPFAPVAGSALLVLPPPVVYAESLSAAEQPREGVPAGEAYQPPAESQPPSESAAPSKEGSRPLTLLQLKDGLMYGLTDYWLEDGRLHYITSYGGENSVPIEQIDFDKTVQLNWERGVEFVLRPKPSTR